MSTSLELKAKLERRRRLPGGASVRVRTNSVKDSVSVRAIKVDERSESLDSF